MKSISKKLILLLILLITTILLLSCNNDKLKSNNKIIIEDTFYKNPETGVSFNYNVNLTPLNIDIYKQDKEAIHKFLAQRKVDVPSFIYKLEDIDINFYDIKDIKYITKISYTCRTDKNIKDFSMEDAETLKTLRNTLSSNIIEGSELMEEADFNIDRFDPVPYVKYSFIDKKTKAKIVVIQTIFIDEDKVHSLSFFTEANEYINSISYFHEILETFQIQRI